MRIDERKVRVRGAPVPVIYLDNTKAKNVAHLFLRSFTKALFPGAQDSATGMYALQAMGLGGAVTMHCARDHPGLTEEEWGDVKDLYKRLVADPLTTGTPRKLSLVNLKSAIRVARDRGAVDFLRALDVQVPDPADSFEVVAKVKHADRAEDDALASLAQEMAAYKNFPDPDEDEGGAGGVAGKGSIGRPRVIALKPCSSMKKYLNLFKEYRLKRLNTDRDGGACATSTVDNEVRIALRFAGWLKKTEGAAGKPRTRYTFRIFTDKRIGKLVNDYLEDLRSKGRRWSTCANYSNALYSCASFQERHNEHSSPGLLELYRLRQQCEKEARVDGVWKKAHNFIDWEKAQEARMLSIQKMKDYSRGDDMRKKAKLVRRCLLMHLMTILPVDRCSVIRRLKLGDEDDNTATLKEIDMSFYIDLRHARGAHKTARFFGPSMTRLPDSVTPLIVEWMPMRKFLLPHVEDSLPDYLFLQGRQSAKVLSESGFSQLVATSFKQLVGVPTTMKQLRASFTTWLRGQKNAPAELLASCAHGLKHSLQTDESSVYDKKVHDRINKAAFDFTTTWSSKWESTRKGAVTPGGLVEPPVGTRGYGGSEWDDECACGDGGDLLCCSYCRSVAHDTGECRGPCPSERDLWHCIACNERWRGVQG